MTDDEFLKQLREAFAIEAEEHVQAMTAGLLELERKPAPARRKEVVETIFRDAHSLKGAARAVSRDEIESVCQPLEGIFAEWKISAVSAPPETFDLLNRAVDLLRNLLHQSGAQINPADRMKVTRIVRELEAVTTALASTPLTPPSDNHPASAMSAPPETELPPPTETVRVTMTKLDLLMRRTEELIALKLNAHRNTSELRSLNSSLEMWRKEWSRVRELTRGGLAKQTPAALSQLANFLEWSQDSMHSTERGMATLISAAEHDERSASTLINDLLDETKRLLMLPCGTLLDLFPKIVRDLSRARDKEVLLSLHGREVEIDKRILQEMKDPLIHLVRNSIDHGIEPSGERDAAHKPRAGTLTLAVSQMEGGKVEILIRDDGAGIDVEKVTAAAVRAGTLAEDTVSALDPHAALALIFGSGVSTSPSVTEISGRGLGMAIVKEKVEKLGGRIAIESERGAGTTFQIVLPVTLAALKGILVSVAGQSFVIPTSKVERTTRVRREDIRTVENRETILLDGQAMALAQLDETLELPPARPDFAFVEIVVLGSAERRIAFAVDAVMSEQEILVKSIGKPLQRVRNVAGATILGSGTPAIILNTSDLLKTAVRQSVTPGHRGIKAAAPSEQRRKQRILVADDSVTSRILLKNILESAGYEVATAIDGVEAIASLKNDEFDLLVSDVDMPRMDGFGLTSKVRADAGLVELPVVLVTSLGSREFQERGIEAGANAYIVKSSFDQSNLLEIIRKLL